MPPRPDTLPAKTSPGESLGERATVPVPMALCRGRRGGDSGRDDRSVEAVRTPKESAACCGAPLLLLVSLLVCLAAVPAARAVAPAAAHYYQQAQAEMVAGRISNAMKFLAEAERIAPGDPDLARLRTELLEARDGAVAEAMRAAQAAEFAKDIPTAIAAWRKVLALQPDHPKAKKALDQLTDVVRQVDHKRQAGIHVPVSSGRVYDLQTYSALEEMIRCREALKAGRFEQARTMVAELRKRNPTYREAQELETEIETWFRIRELIEEARNRLRSGAGLEALAAIDRALAARPHDPALMLLRVEALIMLGLYPDAMAELEKAWKLGVPTAEALPLLAVLYERRGDVDRALAIRAMSGYPEATSTSHWLRIWWSGHRLAGTLLMLLLAGNLYGVIWLFRQVEAVVGQLPISTWFEVAGILIRAEIGGAQSQLEAMGKLQPRLRLPWFDYLLGVALLGANQPDLAVKFLQRVIDRETLAARAYFFLGLIRLIECQEALAASNFEQCLCRLIQGAELTSIPPAFRCQEIALLALHRARLEADPLGRLAATGINALLTGQFETGTEVAPLPIDLGEA